MKPRIKAGWYRAHGFGVELWGWRCEGEFGLTPAGAYEVWRSKQLVEQQIWPPKPTLWQQIKNFKGDDFLARIA